MKIREVVAIKPLTPQQLQIQSLEKKLKTARLQKKQAKLNQQQIKLNQQRSTSIS